MEEFDERGIRLTSTFSFSLCCIVIIIAIMTQFLNIYTQMYYRSIVFSVIRSTVLLLSERNKVDISLLNV